MTLFRITGLFLIVVPVLFNVVFFALGRTFAYPDILRKPTDEILKRFAAGGPRLIRLWYAFGVTALLAIPMTLLVYGVFADSQPQLAVISAIVGTLSGLVQALGLFRWPFLVPHLAAVYNDPNASSATREAVGVVFKAFHEYVGVMVGEHLGYLFTASWSVLVAVMMLTSPLFSPLLPVFGIVSAIGILAGLLEPAGWKPAGMVNALSYLAWSLWLILTGLTFLFA